MMDRAIRLIGLGLLLPLAAPGQVFNESGWRLAVPDDPTWQWRFPERFAPQTDFKTEWWYYTGHLKSETGRQFGYQLTFFRIGMLPSKRRIGLFDREKAGSAWRFAHLWMGHFAITDEQEGEFRHFERLVRGAAGLAGADRTDARHRLHIGDWSIDQSSHSGPSDGGESEAGEVRIRAEEEGWSVELVLEPTPVVLQGEGGLSQKTAGRGRASYYYSRVQIPTKGKLTRSGQVPISVSGSTWFDREIGSNQLAENQSGWDWFAIQLDSGLSVMLYRMRLKSGGIDPYSHGKWIPAEALTTGDEVAYGAETLTAGQFQIKPLRHWSSAESGAEYPVEWWIKLPERQLELRLQATVENQEFVGGRETGVTYWEGSHRVEGRWRGEPVQGKAYVEMTGYAEPMSGF